MRLLFIPFLLAALALSQETAPKVESKALDKETFYHLESLDAKIEALGERYRLAEYRRQLDPLVEERNKIVTTACAGVGVLEKEIEARCRVLTKEKEFPGGVLQWIDKKSEPSGSSPRVDSKTKQ